MKSSDDFDFGIHAKGMINTKVEALYAEILTELEPLIRDFQAGSKDLKISVEGLEQAINTQNVLLQEQNRLNIDMKAMVKAEIEKRLNDLEESQSLNTQKVNNRLSNVSFVNKLIIALVAGVLIMQFIFMITFM